MPVQSHPRRELSGDSELPALHPGELRRIIEAGIARYRDSTFERRLRQKTREVLAELDAAKERVEAAHAAEIDRALQAWDEAQEDISTASVSVYKKRARVRTREGWFRFHLLIFRPRYVRLRNWSIRLGTSVRSRRFPPHSCAPCPAVDFAGASILCPAPATIIDLKRLVLGEYRRRCCGKPVVEIKNHTTVLSGNVREHSQKPIEFYNLVEAHCPAPRYAYLFSRYRHNVKWDCHGDEAPRAPEPDSEAP